MVDHGGDAGGPSPMMIGGLNGDDNGKEKEDTKEPEPEKEKEKGTDDSQQDWWAGQQCTEQPGTEWGNGPLDALGKGWWGGKGGK